MKQETLPVKRLFKTVKQAKKYIIDNSKRIGNELYVKEGIHVFNHKQLENN